MTFSNANTHAASAECSAGQCGDKFRTQSRGTALLKTIVVTHAANNTKKAEIQLTVKYASNACSSSRTSMHTIVDALFLPGASWRNTTATTMMTSLNPPHRRLLMPVVVAVVVLCWACLSAVVAASCPRSPAASARRLC